MLHAYNVCDGIFLVIEYVIACDLKIKMQMCRRHQKSKNNTTLVQD